MTEELRLPPHIVMIQGQYFSNLTKRFIRAEKIGMICDLYWKNEGMVDSYDEIKPVKIVKPKKVRPVREIYREPEPIITRRVMFSDRVNELISAGKVRVMTWDEYQKWKKGKAK